MSSEPSGIFPARLRAARELRQLDQEALAKRATLNPTAISHFEAGRRKPSFDNLRRLADALGVTTDYLLGRADEIGAVAATSDTLFRDFSRLTAEDQEVAKGFMKLLAERNSKRRGEAEN